MGTNCKKKEKTEGKNSTLHRCGQQTILHRGHWVYVGVCIYRSDKPDPGTPHVVDTRETPKKTAINKNNKNNTLRIIIICKKKVYIIFKIFKHLQPYVSKHNYVHSLINARAPKKS